MSVLLFSHASKFESASFIKTHENKHINDIGKANYISCRFADFTDREKNIQELNFEKFSGSVSNF